MRKLGAVLLILVAFASYAGKNKPPKNKSKRFEAVAVTASSAAGSYRGPDDSYGLILEVSDDGTLRGNYVEMGRLAVLNAIVIDGVNFTARANFDDGSSRTIRGSFANRVLNGQTALGLRMTAVPVPGMDVVNTFFERL